MPDQVQLRGLKILAHCGAYEVERVKLQPFEIDLDIESDQTHSGQSDSLIDAIDYELICEAILSLANKEEFSLLERMAQRILDILFETDKKIDGISITLKKVRPPLQADITTAGVCIYRSRK